MNTPQETVTYDKKGASKFIHLSIRSIDNLIARRAIEYIKIGKSVRFSKAALTKFLADRTVNATN